MTLSGSVSAGQGLALPGQTAPRTAQVIGRGDMAAGQRRSQARARPVVAQVRQTAERASPQGPARHADDPLPTTERSRVHRTPAVR